MAKKKIERDVTEDPRYHDTCGFSKNTGMWFWSMELSVQQVRKTFQIEFGSSIEDFLESIYLAGVDLGRHREIENHARCIERSTRCSPSQNAVDMLRVKHKHGEVYYWLLYYSFLSPQQFKNVEEVIEQLRPHIQDISFPTYYRKRKQAVEALSSILWGYTSQECMEILEKFFP